MTPQDFPEANLRIGEGQPEYQVLPGIATPDGEVITCWRPSLWEWFKVLWTRRVWLHQHTFNRPFAPVIVSCHKLFIVAPPDADTHVTPVPGSDE